MTTATFDVAWKISFWQTWDIVICVSFMSTWVKEAVTEYSFLYYYTLPGRESCSFHTICSYVLWRLKVKQKISKNVILHSLRCLTCCNIILGLLKMLFSTLLEILFCLKHSVTLTVKEITRNITIFRVFSSFHPSEPIYKLFQITEVFQCFLNHNNFSVCFNSNWMKLLRMLAPSFSEVDAAERIFSMLEHHSISIRFQVPKPLNGFFSLCFLNR